MRISDWSSDVCSSDLGRRASCRQDDINALMVRLARQGKHVVRLKSGDPMIFGRAGEEIASLRAAGRSEEHTSELQSLMRISYAVFCLKKKKNKYTIRTQTITSTVTLNLLMHKAKSIRKRDNKYT